MWPFKKKEQVPTDPNQQAFQNFQNSINTNNSNQNNYNSQNQYTQQPSQQQYTQNNYTNVQPQTNTQSEKNVYIRKDQNGYAIILYVVLILAFIAYFIFFR